MAVRSVTLHSLTDVEIAKQAGVHKATLERWKKAPEFQVRVREVRASLESEASGIALQYGIADARERIRSLDERWKKMRRVIAERAEDPVMEEAAGGRTGLLVHRRRVIGHGGNSLTVDEYQVDTGLLRELRETARQAYSWKTIVDRSFITMRHAFWRSTDRVRATNPAEHVGTPPCRTSLN
jgi:hypothetical protein